MTSTPAKQKSESEPAPLTRRQVLGRIATTTAAAVASVGGASALYTRTTILQSEVPQQMGERQHTGQRVVDLVGHT